MRWSLFWLIQACLLGVQLLAGCASGRDANTGLTANGNDLVTESDEPEIRKRARLRTELASGYFEKGQLTVALDEVKQAISADGSYAPAYSLRGLVYMRLNEPDLARDSFRRAVNLSPKNGDIIHNYGWFLCQQKSYSEADVQFQNALNLANYPSRAKTYLAQGVCFGRAGKPQDAEIALQRVFELDPSNPIAAFSLAQIYFQRGDFSRAQFHLRRLNDGDLSNAETLWLGLKVERKLGNQLAVKQLGDALHKRFPQSREAQAHDRGAFDE